MAVSTRFPNVTERYPTLVAVLLTAAMLFAYVLVVSVVEPQSLSSAGFRVHAVPVFLIVIIGVVARRGFINRRNMQLSEARLVALGEQSYDFIWELDSDLRFTYFSEGYEKLTGTNPATVLGEYRWEVGAPVGLTEEEWNQHKDDLMAHRAFDDLRFCRISERGDPYWLSVSGRPTHDVTGQFSGYTGIGRDVTSELEATRALRESERRFRDFATFRGDYIWEIDKNMDMTYISERYTELCGLAVEEQIGKPVRDVWSWATDELSEADVEQYFEDMQAHKDMEGFEYWLQSPDGSIRWLTFNISRFFDEEGAFAGYRGVSSDVTETRNAETALRQIERRNRTILDNLPVELTLKDRQGVYVYANETFCKFSSHKPVEEVIGTKAIEWLVPDSIAVIEHMEKQVFEFGEAVDKEVAMESLAQPGQDKGRVDILHLFKFPVFEFTGDATPSFVGTVSVDISERRAFEQQLVLAKEGAEVANRSKTDFLANMSHELRTP